MAPRTRWILFFDGTRNNPRSDTNVHRLYQAAACDSGSVRQEKRYWHGVGIKPWEMVRGSVFGRGLSKNIWQGYQWLALNS